MKRKALLTVGIVVVSLVIVGVVYAFSIGNADGVWGQIDVGGSAPDATCSTWATGPANAPTSQQVSWWNQTGSDTDENQVRYGTTESYSYLTCETTAPTDAQFATQSGLGFDGNNNSPALTVAEGTPFWLGRFTHYNYPICRYLGCGSSGTHYNALEYVTLDVTVAGLACGNGQPPNEGSTLSFSYRVDFVETPNDADPCPYGGDSNGCYDRVTVGSAPPAQQFTCDDPDEPSQSKGVYTISLLGFQGHTSNDCSTQTYNAGSITSQFITKEETANHACLWAQITDFDPTELVVSSFTASANKGVTLRWETVSETKNVGFNLYRAQKIDGPRTQVNEDIIPSQAPGSSEGAVYTYEDMPMAGSKGYFYWLETVDISGNTRLHGPFEVKVK